MTNWTARAKSAISKMGQGCTDKTDETPLSSVSSVGIWAVFENTQLASDLIEAAMKVCDRHGDGEAARADMRQQCLELPPHLQADLLEHFQGKRTNLH